MGGRLGAFWMGPGSFGVPLLLPGCLIVWLDRCAIAPPTYLAWSLPVWTAGCALIFEPAPWLLASAASVLLLIGIRRAPC